MVAIPIPYTYAADNLPPGLDYNITPNTITGRPNNPGNYTVTYTVTDAAGATATMTQIIGISVNLQAPVNTAIGIQEQILTLNEPYFVQLPEWIEDIYIDKGLEGTLPNGLRFDGINRSISGTPTETGNFDLVYRGISTITNLSSTLDFRLRVLAARSGTPIQPIEGRPGTNTTTTIGLFILPIG